MIIPEIWTPEEVANYLKVKTDEIIQLVKTNEIPHFLVGTRHVRFRSDEVIRWAGGNNNHGAQGPVPSGTSSGPNRWVVSHDKKTLFVILNHPHTAVTYSLIPIAGERRWFLPGYKVDFTLETDVGDICTRVTSAPAGVRIGDPKKGNYVQGGLSEWFRLHKTELEEGKLCIRVKEVKKGERYRLDLVQREDIPLTLSG